MGSERNSPSYIDSAVRVIGLAAPAALIISVAYDWGYYKALGWSFWEIPTSISDHLRTTVIWAPLAVTANVLLFIVHAISNPPSTVKTSNELNGKSPDIWKKVTFGLFFAVGLGSYILFGRLFGLVFVIVLIWHPFFEWAIRERLPELSTLPDRVL